jgi:HNH endonuclease
MSITPIPVEMKMAVLDLHGWNCLCCGRPTHRYPDARVRPDTLSFDHVIPEKHGGPTVVENLQPLCMACNLHKGIDTIDHRLAARQELNEIRFIRANVPDGAIFSRKAIGLPRPHPSTVWKVPIWRTNEPEQLFSPAQITPDLRLRWNTVSFDWFNLKFNKRRTMPPCPVREQMRLAA